MISGNVANRRVGLVLLLSLAAIYGLMLTSSPTSHHPSRSSRSRNSSASNPPEVPIEVSLVSSPVSNSTTELCPIESLRSIVKFDDDANRWVFQPSTWCGIPLPLHSDYLQRKLKGKRVFFLGDSVARNSFVVTMAKLCNEGNMYKCMIRMPTHEYDMVKPANESGPMGCLPQAIGNSGKRSLCFEAGKFAFVPLKGLTTKSVPQDRAQRRTFINKGLIGPALHMHFSGTDLIYLPVNRPHQITKTARWILSPHGVYLRADYTIVSIGPHLKFQEVLISPSTLNESIGALRAALGPLASIVVAEFVHGINSQHDYVEMVDGLMRNLSAVLSAYHVPLVPQRHITRHGYVLRGFNVAETDKQLRRPDEECGYYDKQHPALRCQVVATDLLLAAAFSQAPVNTST